MAGRLRWGQCGKAFLSCERSQIYCTTSLCKCGGNTHLIRRSPRAVKDSEARVFECYECGRQIEQIITGEDRVP